MDLIKIIFIVLLVIATLVVIVDWRIKWLFWMGALLMFCRRLNFPYLGEIEPSTVALCLAALLVFQSLIEILLNKYPLQLFVLAFGIFNAYAMGNQGEETWNWALAIFMVFLFCGLAEIFVKSERDLDRLSTIFIFIAFIVTFTSILGFAGLADGVVILDNNTANNVNGEIVYSRTYGIAYDNSVLGYAPIALIFLTHKKWRWVYKTLIFASITVAVLISLKRLAYLSLAFSIIYILLTERKQIRLFPFLLGLGIFAVGLYRYGDLIIERFMDVKDVFQGDESPDVNRTSIINHALHSIAQHPLLGKGSGSLIFVHNGYLEMAANLGLLSLLIIIPWFAKPVKYLFGKTDPRQKTWAIACLIYLSTLFLLEAALNRFELMWIFGLLYAGFLRSTKIYQARQYNIQWKEENLAFQ